MVQHLVNGNPDLVNMKKSPGNMSFLQEAEANGKTEVANFLRQHGAHE